MWGVAMGITGTEVSKDAAAMILADDNFATIVKAVLNGRSVYANIRNAIQFLLSGNMGAILAVIYASLAGLSVPFQPVHLLFINLLTDSLPAIALGMEPARPGLMDQKPRDPNASMMDKPMLTHVFGQGLMIGVAAMIAFYIGLAQGGAALASTMAFATLTLARLFHGFNCRGTESIFRLGLSGNPYSLMAFGTGVLLLAFVLFVPALEGTVPGGPRQRLPGALHRGAGLPAHPAHPAFPRDPRQISSVFRRHLRVPPFFVGCTKYLRLFGEKRHLRASPSPLYTGNI